MVKHKCTWTEGDVITKIEEPILIIARTLTYIGHVMLGRQSWGLS